jgi:hypothetical protein
MLTNFDMQFQVILRNAICCLCLGIVHEVPNYRTKRSCYSSSEGEAFHDMTLDRFVHFLRALLYYSLEQVKSRSIQGIYSNINFCLIFLLAMHGMTKLRILK